MSLNPRQKAAIEVVTKSACITNAGYQKDTGASRPSAIRDLADLAGSRQNREIIMNKIVSNEYMAKKGDVKLYMFRKRLAESTEARQGSKPILFLVQAQGGLAPAQVQEGVDEKDRYQNDQDGAYDAAVDLGFPGQVPNRHPVVEREEKGHEREDQLAANYLLQDVMTS